MGRGKAAKTILIIEAADREAWDRAELNTDEDRQLIIDRLTA